MTFDIIKDQGLNHKTTVMPQVLMRTHDRLEGTTAASASSNGARVKELFAVQKKLQRLSWNVLEAIALLKNLASDLATALFGKIESSRKLVWRSVARSRNICASL
ncbi:hypothetical protein COP2_035346 [Malus domestica]